MIRRGLAWPAVVAVAVAACASAPQAARTERVVPPAAEGVTTVPSAVSIAAGQSVWTNVAVATLWVSTTSPRTIDAPALSNPVHIKAWLASMSTQQRLGLVGRVETQALYGERLLVTRVSGSWVHVVAVNQPTHRDRRGYPGWVPARQVTTHAPVVRPTVATVVVPLALLRTTSGVARLTVGFGTRLPVLGTAGTRTVVATPTGGRLTVRTSYVVVHPRTSRARALTRAGVLATAKSLIGVPYLWGARSGYALDCSGFTELVYNVHGVRLPRDADDQAAAGTAVRISAPGVADLMFFGSSASSITHVGFYAGGGMLLHAPRTGSYVRLTSLSSMSRPVAVRTFI